MKIMSKLIRNKKYVKMQLFMKNEFKLCFNSFRKSYNFFPIR